MQPPTNTAILTPDPDEPNREMEALSDDELLERISRCLARTAENFRELARAIAEAERRGKDLSHFRRKLGATFDHLRKVACGQILPDVVVRFFGKSRLTSAIGNLPLSDQQRLAEGERVKLCVMGPDGRPEVRMYDPLEMSDAQIKQAFAPDHIRDESAQVAHLDRQRAKDAAPVPEQVGPFKTDHVLDGVYTTVARGAFISRADMEAALSVLRKKKDGPRTA